MDVTKTLDDDKSVGSANLPKDPDNVLERCDDMDVTKTLDDDKSVGSTNLLKDAGNVLEQCDDMDVTKTLDDDKSVGSTNLPKDAGSVLFPVDSNESTQTFPEDNSLMDLDKTLVRSDDHDATIKKDYADVDLSKTSNKRTYSDSQYCPFKKRFKGRKGNEFTHDQSGVGDDQFGVGEGADSKTNFVEKRSQSPEDSYSQEVISLVKRHFIVQDLGVAEMLAEGDSQIHVYVHAKDDLKELVQRLIVHIGENKGWEVYFQRVPIVQIPNIQHLIGSGQTSIVYTDIALEHNNPLESTEKNSYETDASNSNPVSDRTQGDVHAEVTNMDDVVNGSSKTPVVGGEVRYSVRAQVTNTNDVVNGSSKTPVVGGEVRYSD